MSESINMPHGQSNFRYCLLVTVSSAALLASIALARADDTPGADVPALWIEVGGALDQISAAESDWLPPNLTLPISKPQPLPFGKLPAIGFDTDLKLSFAPEDSDWVYSAAIRYGRAQFGPKNSHDQTYKFNSYTILSQPKYHWTNYDFADTARQSRSMHAIVDFAAGKDVGLGIFDSKSTVSFGLRIVQLNEKTDGQLTAFQSAPGIHSPGEVAHRAELVASRSFNGIGPSVAWDASAPLIGALSNGFSLDWGANAAILFGRQKANVSLRTKDLQYNTNGMSGIPVVLTHSTQTPARNKTVVVPNLGGFAGLSWHLPSAKVSLGYRADFFFGAIDGGLTTSQKETRGFYGPFANVSIGIGG